MNPIAQPDRVSNEAGRQWLSNLLVQHLNITKLPKTSARNASAPMVNIPYFSDPDHPIGRKTFGTFAADDIDLKSESLLLAMTNAPAEKVVDPKFDISESADQWIEEKETGPDPQRIVQPKTCVDSAVAGLVDSILDRFPLAAPVVLLFTGSDDNPHVDTTCEHVAKSLAELNIGNVLLVDSNRGGELTDDRGLECQAGLSEIVNEGQPWSGLITNQNLAALDFLPVGTAAWEQWGGAERLRNAAAEMKRQYQFVCVSAGDAHQNGARLWSSVCDGSYLLVSLKNSNQTIAESAVTELQVSGARLLGCVVTEA